MIFGIGIDDIEVERVGRQVRSEDGFTESVFTPGEIEYCESRRNSAQGYAARFAAKEAFLKAIGTGWRDGMAFSEIEIVNDDFGKPQLVLHGKAREHAEANGITNIQVSLSHLKHTASAVVTLEK
ncbi:MAG: holo-ACP synthase [candidate division Zixibacteria bacterium]|nr:holo-ACP synthase [candidate division Zixibacteria bacterium]